MFSKPAKLGAGAATGHLGGGIPRFGADMAGKARGKGTPKSQMSRQEEAVVTPVAQDSRSPGKGKKSTRVKGEKGNESIRQVRSGALNRPRRVKKEISNPGADASASTDEEGEETDASERKLNIDFINLLSDDEDNDSDAARELRDTPMETTDLGAAATTAAEPFNKPQHHSFASFRPVRLQRQEYIDRPLEGIGTGASAGKYLTSAELRRRAKERTDAQGSLFMDDDDDLKENRKVGTWRHGKGRGKGRDLQVLGGKKVWKGAWGEDDDNETGEGLTIKEESTDGMDVDIEAVNQVHNGGFAKSLPTAVERSSPIRQQWNDPQPQSSAPIISGSHQNVTVPNSNLQDRSSSDSECPIAASTHQSRRRSSISSRPLRLRKPKFQNREEELEWQRYEEDLLLMGTILRSGTANERTLSQGRGQQGVVPNAMNVDGEDATKKEDHTDHTPPTQPPATADAKVGKIYMIQLPPLLPHMDVPNPTSSSALLSDNPSAEAGPSNHGDVVDRPQDDAVSAPAPTPLPLTPKTHPSSLQTGRVGFFRLHASSRVTMTWGDMLFALGRSASDSGNAGRGSLQEVVVMNHDSDVKRTEEAKHDSTTLEKSSKSKEKGRSGQGDGKEGVFKIKIEDDKKIQAECLEGVSDHGHAFAAMDVDENGDAMMGDGSDEKISDMGKGKDEEANDRKAPHEDAGAWAIGEINGGFVGVPDFEGMFG